MKAIIFLVEMKIIPDSDLPIYWSRKEKLAQIFDIVNEVEEIKNKNTNYINTKFLSEYHINNYCKN